ncbi:MAG: hypothetical protein QOF68_1755 [Gaiellales bacterium]|jgi:hypothetical protein|nr:hypothetical protein [Gaiellales bacterium]
MKVLIERLWREPALASGLLLSAALLLGEVLIGDGLTSSDLPAILAPLGAAGITRRYVSPTEGEDGSDAAFTDDGLPDIAAVEEPKTPDEGDKGMV